MPAPPLPKVPLRSSSPHSALRPVQALALIAAALGLAPGRAAAEPGHGGDATSVWALRDARVIVGPGQVLEHGTLVVRQGRIEAVGEHIAVPLDARVLDLHGKTVHAGFIDPYVTAGRLEGNKHRRRTSDADGDEDAALEAEDEKDARPVHLLPGSSNPRVHAAWRISDLLKPQKKALDGLRSQGFTLVQAVYDHGIFRGQAAVYSLVDGLQAEQIVRDATAAVITFEMGRGGDKGYPGSMMGNVAVMRQAFADTAWYLESSSLASKSYPGSQRPGVESSLLALQPPLLGQQPVLAEAETLLEVLRLQRVLDEAHIARRVTVLSGEEWRRLDWLKPKLRSSEWILPIDFPSPPKARTQGERNQLSQHALEAWHNAPANPGWLTHLGLTYSLTTHRLEKVEDFPKHLQQALRAGLDPQVALAALTVIPARQLGLADRYGTLQVGKAASLVIRKGDWSDPKSEVEEVWVEGSRHVLGDEREAPEAKPGQGRAAASKAKPQEQAAHKPTPGKPPMQPPLPPTPAGNGTVLVRNATIWTQGPQGVQPGADLLVVGGKVKAVGPRLAAPPGARIVDGTHLHVTPGIIDAHSHTAIDGAANEMLAPVTSQVRIKDVINPFDINIYRQLAGGVTAANVLHGSANAINGQVVTCKWRWGADSEHLIMEGAPEGIKLALGENPRHANRHVADAAIRYPRTRMGVAELIRERFAAARSYRAAQEAWQAGKRPLPPRPDLQLEPLLEILDGKRLIHCHSYRQDEILALLRIAAQEGFKVHTFQHVLEGYKVADEIARHGSMASTFSDWWAYKMEVMDAIPYNGALLHQRGVVTSFNSDSDEQARRLNTEAAKAVRYGNLSDTEALAFVTMNAALQLGVADRIGSLEPGKDGDFVVWSGHPLHQRSVALETWIEGRRYFEFGQDQERQQALAQRRALLLKALREANHPKESASGSKNADEDEDTP